MDDIKKSSLDDSENINQEEVGKSLVFKCPNDGKIHVDDVLFLCNTCSQRDLVLVDGVYMCPTCLKPGKNFECSICGSTDIEFEVKKAN